MTTLKKIFSIKIFLIGFLIVKLAFSFFYLTGNSGISNMFFFKQTAIAQEKKEKEKKGKEEKKEDKKADNEKKIKETCKQSEHSAGSEPSAGIKKILDSVEKKRLRIKKEEELLVKKRALLTSLKKEVECKIDELSKMQQQIEADFAKQREKEKERQKQRREAQSAKIKRLVKVYTSMKPKTAAALIDKMDMDIALKLFALMKGENIGKILSYVDKNRAAKISERLAVNSKPEK